MWSAKLKVSHSTDRSSKCKCSTGITMWKIGVFLDLRSRSFLLHMPLSKNERSPTPGDVSSFSCYIYGAVPEILSLSHWEALNYSIWHMPPHSCSFWPHAPLQHNNHVSHCLTCVKKKRGKRVCVVTDRKCMCVHMYICGLSSWEHRYFCHANAESRLHPESACMFYPQYHVHEWKKTENKTRGEEEEEEAVWLKKDCVSGSGVE